MKADKPEPEERQRSDRPAIARYTPKKKVRYYGYPHLKRVESVLKSRSNLIDRILMIKAKH